MKAHRTQGVNWFTPLSELKGATLSTRVTGLRYMLVMLVNEFGVEKVQEDLEFIAQEELLWMNKKKEELQKEHDRLIAECKRKGVYIPAGARHG